MSFKNRTGAASGLKPDINAYKFNNNADRIVNIVKAEVQSTAIKRVRIKRSAGDLGAGNA
jgi:hypothetical protein